MWHVASFAWCRMWLSLMDHGKNAPSSFRSALSSFSFLQRFAFSALCHALCSRRSMVHGVGVVCCLLFDYRRFCAFYRVYSKRLDTPSLPLCRIELDLITASRARRGSRRRILALRTALEAGDVARVEVLLLEGLLVHCACAWSELLKVSINVPGVTLFGSAS
jgi:hypothetical protein